MWNLQKHTHTYAPFTFHVHKAYAFTHTHTLTTLIIHITRTDLSSLSSLRSFCTMNSICYECMCVFTLTDFFKCKSQPNQLVWIFVIHIKCFKIQTKFIANWMRAKKNSDIFHCFLLLSFEIWEMVCLPQISTFTTSHCSYRTKRVYGMFSVHSPHIRHARTHTHSQKPYQAYTVSFSHSILHNKAMIYYIRAIRCIALSVRVPCIHAAFV